MNHLRPKGCGRYRSWYHFQSGTAHKQLRKNLVEDGLYAVVGCHPVFSTLWRSQNEHTLIQQRARKTEQEILFVK